MDVYCSFYASSVCGYFAWFFFFVCHPITSFSVALKQTEQKTQRQFDLLRFFSLHSVKSRIFWLQLSNIWQNNNKSLAFDIRNRLKKMKTSTVKMKKRRNKKQIKSIPYFYAYLAQSYFYTLLQISSHKIHWCNIVWQLPTLFNFNNKMRVNLMIFCFQFFLFLLLTEFNLFYSHRIVKYQNLFALDLKNGNFNWNCLVVRWHENCFVFGQNLWAKVQFDPIVNSGIIIPFYAMQWNKEDTFSRWLVSHCIENKFIALKIVINIQIYLKIFKIKIRKIIISKPNFWQRIFPFTIQWIKSCKYSDDITFFRYIRFECGLDLCKTAQHKK